MKYLITEYEGYTFDLILSKFIDTLPDIKSNGEMAFAPFSSTTQALNKFATIICAPFMGLGVNIVAAGLMVYHFLNILASPITGDLDGAVENFVVATVATLILPFFIIGSIFVNCADFIGSAFNSCFEQGPAEIPPQNNCTSESPIVDVPDLKNQKRPKPAHYDTLFSTANNDQFPEWPCDEQSNPKIP